MKHVILFIVSVLLALGCKNSWNSTESEFVLPSSIAEIGALLDSIHIEDQKYRSEIQSIIDNYGRDSKEMKAHWKTISQTDKSNLTVVKQIIEEHGWLGADQIGSTANSALFLVIQHADQKSQEEYLPVMREAVKQGTANSRSLALLEDRVALGNGELQIYGSQIGTNQKTGEMYVLPLKNPKTVNKRREEVGLGPIEEYISNWGLVWDPDEYIKELPNYQ